MKHLPVSGNWVKLRVSFLLALILIITLEKPMTVASKPLDQSSMNYLYYEALRSEYNYDDYVHAYAFMLAYRLQNPPDYLNNAEIRKFVDDKIRLYEAEAIRLQVCDQASEQGSSYSQGTIPPPPEAALVCTKAQYQGTCRILFVGEYSTYKSMGVPNDDISSVMVGSRVKLTLFLHSLSHPQYFTFLTDDPDLRDNRISGTNYFWDNNVSSARVQYR